MSNRSAPPLRMTRVDTLGLKDAIDAALPPDRARIYWQTLSDFVAARLSRSEFYDLAIQVLGREHIQLHNDLLVGVLYNASPGVPGPTSAHRFARSARTFAEAGWDSEEDCRPPPHKRLRSMVAALTNRERAGLKGLGSHRRGGPAGIGGASDGNDPSLEWAGMAADLLERKRREDDRRRAVEGKRRYRETRTAIGQRDWRSDVVAGQEFVEAAHPRLPTSVQQALQRTALAPPCLEAKELPDTDTLRDRMTLIAVKHGLTQGVHPQAASMLLLALQNHLQTIANLTLRKLRPPEGNEPGGESSTPSPGAHASGSGQSSRARTIALPDVAFALDATPSSVVEPLGLGPTKRLTLPDWADEVEVERETLSVHDSHSTNDARWNAVAKVGPQLLVTNTQKSSDRDRDHARSESESSQRRSRYAVDTLATARWVDPGALQFATPATTGANSAPTHVPEGDGALGKRAYHLWEVVDPVALLHSL